MKTHNDDVSDQPCVMCGEPIGNEEWLYDDRCPWPGEEHREDVPIHDRCAG